MSACGRLRNTAKESFLEPTLAMAEWVFLFLSSAIRCLEDFLLE